MKVYAILLSYGNSDDKLINENVVRMLKEHHGGAVNRIIEFECIDKVYSDLPWLWL